MGRLIVGGLLLLVGLGLFAGGIDAISGLGTVVLAALVTAAGVTLVLGPWLVGLARDLGRERTERFRQEERAEVAAHLHDSVLQTLALIQRSEDPRKMASLAAPRSGSCEAGCTGGPRCPRGRDLLSTALRSGGGPGRGRTPRRNRSCQSG